MEEVGPLDPETYERRTTLSVELNDILADEELLWLRALGWRIEEIGQGHTAG